MTNTDPPFPESDPFAPADVSPPADPRAPEANGHIPSESFASASPIRLPTKDTDVVPEAEAQLLCDCLIDALDPNPTFDRAINLGVDLRCFTVPMHLDIWRAMTSLAREGSKPTLAAVSAHMEARGELTIERRIGLNSVSRISSTTAEADPIIRTIIDYRTRRSALEAGFRLTTLARDPSTPIRESVQEITASLSGIESNSMTGLRDLYLKRQFNQANPPAELPPRFLINGRGVCSPGNMTTVISQAKTGKTAKIGAAIAAAICAGLKIEGRDTLGITASDPEGAILIHIDTEQSMADHDRLIRTAMRRAGVDSLPPWIWSFGLAGFSSKQLRAVLKDLIQRALHHGVYACILDGTADFVDDVNDPGECNPFVSELHACAIDYNCPIINVVHENPGQDSGKMRGHLGSQLERKAESNLRLKKTNEITVVFSEKMRRAPILEKDGPRFQWSIPDGMHMSVASGADAKADAEREKLLDLAQAAFQHLGRSSAKYGDLIDAFKQVRKIGDSYADARFTAMKKCGVIQKDIIGHWQLVDQG